MKDQFKDFPDELRGIGELGRFEYDGKVWYVKSHIYPTIDRSNNIIYMPGRDKSLDDRRVFIPKGMIPKLEAVIKDYVKSFVRLKGLPASAYDYVSVKHISRKALEGMYNVLMGKQDDVFVSGCGIVNIRKDCVCFGMYDITVDEAWDNLEIMLDKKIELEQEVM